MQIFVGMPLERGFPEWLGECVAVVSKLRERQLGIGLAYREMRFVGNAVFVGDVSTPSRSPVELQGAGRLPPSIGTNRWLCTGWKTCRLTMRK